MLEIEKTNTEKMLREFWLIHRHFTEHPELLKDDAVSRVYDGLMALRDVDGLKDWLRLKEAIDTKSDEPVRYEDMLGRIYQLAIHSEQSELRWAADGMALLADNGFHDTLANNLPVLERQRQDLVGDSSDAIVIFKQGNGNFSYGQDADRLFEQMGWQTSEAQVGDKKVSWMPVNDEGIQAMSESGKVFLNPQPNVPVIRVEDVSQEVIDNEMLSLAQQKIDYIRQDNKRSEAIMSLGMFPVMLHKDDICEVESAQFIELHGKNVDLVMTDGRSIPLVKDNSWIMSGNGRDYLIAAGEKLMENQNEALMQLQTYDTVRMMRQMRTDDILDEYIHLKKEHSGEVLMVKHDGFTEAYGDDAVTIAKATKAHLWERETNYGRTVSMVMLTPVQVDMADVALENTHIAVSELKEKQENLGLKSSPLNEVVYSKRIFDDGGVMKKRSGEYVAWARLEGHELPEVIIAPYRGVQFSRLSDGPEKEATLKLILQQCYEDALFKHDEKQLSSTVKIA